MVSLLSLPIRGLREAVDTCPSLAPFPHSRRLRQAHTQDSSPNAFIGITINNVCSRSQRYPCRCYQTARKTNLKTPFPASSTETTSFCSTTVRPETQIWVCMYTSITQRKSERWWNKNKVKTNWSLKLELYWLSKTVLTTNLFYTLSKLKTLNRIWKTFNADTKFLCVPLIAANGTEKTVS